MKITKVTKYTTRNIYAIDNHTTQNTTFATPVKLRTSRLYDLYTIAISNNTRSEKISEVIKKLVYHCKTLEDKFKLSPLLYKMPLIYKKNYRSTKKPDQELIFMIIDDLVEQLHIRLSITQ